ncbi:MAG TPA: peptidase M20, partial [Plesiomonas shigelloides]|nr:peptidase M20 [Plesiomonas shigelloides]
MQLNTYLEELKPLINIDCGTSTVEGVAAVAEMMAQKYRDLNWHTEVVDLG